MEIFQRSYQRDVASDGDILYNSRSWSYDVDLLKTTVLDRATITQ